ncbi:hypothetical protein FHR38_003232 [Micromonospora polyrhachis]|uniref:Uncharacterized protein n=1 Tax=Micromonospora polyrhachis TaxID=1282883 RepID=A0A7W7SR89_9ACTN|nr:hypothetical protein [Micromonospora polyrhachis]
MTAGSWAMITDIEWGDQTQSASREPEERSVSLRSESSPRSDP